MLVPDNAADTLRFVSDTIDLRVPTFDDLDAIASVVAAQDTAWWGEPDGDIDDVRDELDRAVMASGSLAAGARVALSDEAVVGVGLLFGHGHTGVSVDPAAPCAGAARLALIDWLSGNGGREFDAPSQDVDQLGQLAAHGFRPTRSSFELQRPADVADLPQPMWPPEIALAPFRPGVDDEELHDMIYSFWTDVPGHTHRPFDEWRSLFVSGSWFDPDLVVLTRSDGGAGSVVGCALNRTFNGKVGWVTQLGVARSARGLGLGRATLLEACHRLSRTGVGMIGLGVEAENANALGLYRSVGMDIEREWVHSERPGPHRASWRYLGRVPVRGHPSGDVAQLARAPALQAGGRGFDSHRLHQV